MYTGTVLANLFRNTYLRGQIAGGRLEVLKSNFVSMNLHVW